MAHANTIFAQLLQLLPRHEFQKLAKQHHAGQGLRKVSRWDQFTALCMAQLSGRQSLRDIEANLKAQSASHYHLGCKPIARSSLARLNEKQPYTLPSLLPLAHTEAEVTMRAAGGLTRFSFSQTSPVRWGCGQRGWWPLLSHK